MRAMAASSQRVARLGFVNAYLVEEDDGLTAIDTTFAGGHEGILAAAERMGKPIVRIALTHGHADHTGGLDKLARAAQTAEVLISERDARILGGEKGAVAGEPEAPVKGGWPKLSTTFDRFIAPGDRVGSLEVVAAPGHTPGQLAFLDPRDGTLYCGDAYSTLGGVETCARANPRFPLPALATWHKPTALETAIALRALDPRRLAPGHGKVVDAPGAAMDAAIARARA
jgi:glyoxylase-like metal-dependent hydrolase (beta-lactamase superfamily II)